MSFWQENFGFVKEIYDYRIAKYKEWMDNLEDITVKVLDSKVNYTYKEFKVVQDTLASLCRDLEKEQVKQWLDVMHEKIAMRASEDGGSARDKDLLATEKNKVHALIERHDGLMPKVLECQEKVETFASCYSYRDDVGKILRLLEEMLHLSTKKITHYNKKGVEEQIERAEKLITNLESVSEQYQDFIRRGKTLQKVPHCAPFLGPLIDKLENVWKGANKHSRERVEILNNYARCYSFGDDIGPLLKTLDDVLLMTSKEARAHNKKMVLEQVEKLEKVVSTVESLSNQYSDSIRRGEKLVKSDHCLPFLSPMVEKLQTVFKTASEKPSEKLTMLKTVVNSWEKFDEIRNRIAEPCHRLEEEYKTWGKIYDPKVGAVTLKKRKAVLDECRGKINELTKTIQKSYTTIILLAGEDKRDHLDNQMKDIDTRCSIVAKCENKIKEQEDFNETLDKILNETDELKNWVKTTAQRIQEIRKDKVPIAQKVIESVRLREECRKKLVDTSQLDDDYKKIFPADELMSSDVAKKKVHEFEEIKKNLRNAYGEIELEAGNTSDYFNRVQELCKEFNNMRTATDLLVKTVRSLNPIYNPGLATMEIYFKSISEIYEKKDKILNGI